MIERPDPQSLMSGPLGNWLSGQGQDRMEAKKQSDRYTFYGIVGAVSLGAFVLIVFRSFEPAMWVGAAAFGAGSWAAHRARKQVTDRIKGQINAEIAKALQVGYAMTVSDLSMFERAKAFEMFPDFDDHGFEDEWSGALGAQSFRLHEAKLTEEQGSGNSSRTVTVFQGSILSIGFTRRFIGTTLIERDKRHRGFFGGKKDSIEVNGTALRRVDMVDPRFEGAFAIWSDDGVEARYLVHPEYVERLIAVEQAYAGQDIRALFSGGELLIVIESGDLFESGSLDASQDAALLQKTIDQFGTLADLAQTLNERPRAGFN